MAKIHLRYIIYEIILYWLIHIKDILIWYFLRYIFSPVPTVNFLNQAGALRVLTTHVLEFRFKRAHTSFAAALSKEGCEIVEGSWAWALQNDEDSMAKHNPPIELPFRGVYTVPYWHTMTHPLAHKKKRMALLGSFRSGMKTMIFCVGITHLVNYLLLNLETLRRCLGMQQYLSQVPCPSCP